MSRTGIEPIPIPCRYSGFQGTAAMRPLGHPYARGISSSSESRKAWGTRRSADTPGFVPPRDNPRDSPTRRTGQRKNRRYCRLKSEPPESAARQKCQLSTTRWGHRPGNRSCRAAGFLFGLVSEFHKRVRAQWRFTGGIRPKSCGAGDCVVVGTGRRIRAAASQRGDGVYDTRFQLPVRQKSPRLCRQGSSSSTLGEVRPP